jgi:hypothetical protein
MEPSRTRSKKSDAMMPEKIVLDKRIETFYFAQQFIE